MNTLDEDLAAYQEMYGRPTPIKYDILRLSEDHRKFDALIRRFWDDFHPLVRDAFTSFAREYQYLLHLAEEVEGKKDEEIAALKQETVDQLNTLTNMLDQLKSEYEAALSEKNEEFSQINEQQEVFRETITKLSSDLNQLEDELKAKDDQIARLTTDLKKKSSQTQMISKSIANVNEFTQKLKILEQDTIELEREKNTLEGQNSRLQIELRNALDSLSGKQLDIEEKYQDLTVKIKILENQNSELLAAIDRETLFKTQMKDEYQELKKNYEDVNEDLKHKKELLSKQVNINKEYHALTLKVIEHAKNYKKNAEIKSRQLKIPSNSNLQSSVPDLLSQLKLQSTAIQSSKNVDHKLELLSRRQEKLEIDKPPTPAVSNKTVLDEQAKNLVSSFKDKIDKSEKDIMDIMADLPRPPKKKKKRRSGDTRVLS